MKRYFIIALFAAVGFTASSPADAAAGLVCTSTKLVTLTSGQPFPLHNNLRFNCGPTLRNKTVSQLSAAGWIIIMATPVVIEPNMGGWQLIIQK